MTTETQAPDPAPGKNWHAHHVAVSKAALQMVRSALRNDVEAGKTVRGEMLKELDESTFAIPAPEGADERGAFKAAMEPLGFRLRWCEGVPGVTDGWDNSPAAHAWQGWQARAALAAPRVAEGEQAASVSVNVLARMSKPENTDPNQQGHQWAKGWNAAIRQAMDYALAAHPDYPAGQKAAEPGPGIVRCPRCWELVTAPTDNNAMGRAGCFPAAERTNAAPQAAPAWQPIETAPKDGSKVLLLWGDHENEICIGWHEERTSKTHLTPWRRDKWGLTETPYGAKPTHWRPIPAALQTKEPKA